jgi:hypothetical protein
MRRKSHVFMMNDDQNPPLRPKDLALLLLASGDMLPRQRARDQQADLSGASLKSSVLYELVALDPEPDEIEAALDQVVARMGQPTGPTRAVATMVMEDWRAACASPAFVEWLVEQAVDHSMNPQGRPRGRKNRQTRPDDPPGRLDTTDV